METFAIKCCQTVDFWLWVIIIGGFFLIPFRKTSRFWLRYIQAFTHLLVPVAFLCRGHSIADFIIAPVWVMLFFMWMSLARSMHLAHDAQVALKFDSRLDDVEKFLTVGEKLGRYQYKPQFF